MKPQNFAAKNDRIRAEFIALKKSEPKRLKNRLNLSWSNWGFGLEPLANSAARLERAGITWIELHGNHYGPDLGYKPAETLKILGDHGIKVAGVCGMFSPDNDLSSNRAIQRQAAMDYLKREVPFTKAVADSNRCALGEGSLDLDTLIMALYLIGYNEPGRFVTPEPLGPGGDPYPAMNGQPDPALLDRLVSQTARYFREREGIVRARS